MGFGGDGPWALGVMWMLTAIVFFFLLLRLYTRIVCLASYGLDDHAYIVAFIFLLLFTSFTTVAGYYGFGQTMEQIGSIDRTVQATLWECIGQGVAIVAMPIAKSSLGFFLLRLVTIQWHRIAIWCAMTLVTLASIGGLPLESASQLDLDTDSEQHKYSASGFRASPLPMCTTAAFRAATVPSIRGQLPTFFAVRSHQPPS